MYMCIIILVIKYNFINEISMANWENAKKNKVFLFFMKI